jgi:collagenase-like PrtC family protease
MELTVATNWDDRLLDNYNEINKKHGGIREVFGSLRSSVVGNARASSTLPDVNSGKAKQHIELAHKYGFTFNYTFNGTCTSGMEYQADFHHRVLDYLDQVVDLGIDSFVVTIPYYLEIIKNRYPDMPVKVSVMAHVDTVNKMKVWESLGADRIVICDSLNRDFPMLKRMLDESKAELEILAGNCCLHHCPFQYYHQNLVSHMSQVDNPLKGMYVEYPVMRCTLEKMTKPGEIIRGRWLRPEDIKDYEDLGFTQFKVGARQSSVEWNTKTVEAYAGRHYDGNLIHILQGFEPITDIENKQVEGVDQKHWDMFKQGLDAYKGFQDFLYLDNRKLDGFLDHYKNNSCRYNCYKCNYCNTIADKAIRVQEEEKLAILLETIKFVLGGLSISEIMFE